MLRSIGVPVGKTLDLVLNDVSQSAVEKHYVYTEIEKELEESRDGKLGCDAMDTKVELVSGKNKKYAVFVAFSHKTKNFQPSFWQRFK